MSVAAQAMGLGNWIFCGYFDDIHGCVPALAQGLGFRAEPLNERAPAASGALKSAFHPMQCNFGAVVHHVDLAFYERYYDGSTVTPSIRTHIQDWHA